MDIPLEVKIYRAYLNYQDPFTSTDFFKGWSQFFYLPGSFLQSSQLLCPFIRITSYNVCYTKLLRYLDAYCYAKERKPNINMSMQTNMLDYSTDKWYEVLKLVCGGGVSTSFDPDACGRIYQGSADRITSYNVCYTKLLRLWSGQAPRHSYRKRSRATGRKRP